MAPLGFGSTNSGMKPKVRLTMDPKFLKQLDARLKGAVNKALDKALPLLRKMAKEIKEESQEIVPYREGLLHDSAFYQVRRNKESVVAQVGYHVEKVENRGFYYAWIQHETPDPPWQHTDGRRYRYLSEPIERREDDIDDLWATAFEGVFG
tara:strand:- start:170 stop:622 length:453 start_codon:yes stop_codon:yes gene_type:complete